MSVNRFVRLAIIILVVILVVGGGLFVATKVHNRQYSAKLNIQVAPQDATVIINGQKSRSGMVGVKPGNYDIVATRNGFTKGEQTAKVVAGQTQFIGIVLSSNSPDTADWYNQHPEDQKIVEIIAGQEFQKSSDQSVQQVPLIKDLPYIGVGFEFRIDYGEALPGTNVPGIYITAPTQQGYQDALSWIKQQGYDPSSLHIKYTQGSAE